MARRRTQADLGFRSASALIVSVATFYSATATNLKEVVWKELDEGKGDLVLECTYKLAQEEFLGLAVVNKTEIRSGPVDSYLSSMRRSLESGAESARLPRTIRRGSSYASPVFDDSLFDQHADYAAVAFVKQASNV